VATTTATSPIIAPKRGPSSPFTARNPRTYTRAGLRSRGGTTWTVVALTAVAAFLRFATLDLQSFSDAETYTVLLVRMELADMLDAIPRLEGTPPLYYVLLYGWSELFGTGEVGLRSLSVLVSTAVVPLTFLAARQVTTNRAALVAAGVVAVNPLLVWFGQEARAYSLLVLLSTAALLFFLRRRLVAWSVASALGIATHYFAVLLFLPQALWLIVTSRPRRPTLVASAAPIAVGIALAPLALRQTEQAGGDETEIASLGLRLARIPKQFLVGFEVPAEVPLTAIGALAALIGVVLAARRPDAELRRLAPVAIVGGAGLLLMLAMAAAGSDYVLSRYLVLLVPVFAIVAAAGFTASRAGIAAAVALVAVSLTAVALVAVDPGAQRPDYRGALEALGPARGGRAVAVTTIGAHHEIYLPGARALPKDGIRVREMVVVGLRAVGGESRERPRPAIHLVPRGFRPVESVRTDSYVRLRYRSSQPRLLSPLVLLEPHPEADASAILVQR
jgi:hypothetical protein